MPLSATFLTALKDLFPAGALLTDPADCWVYGYDNSKRQVLPDAVVFIDTHEQALALVRLCNVHEVPLTASNPSSFGNVASTTCPCSMRSPLL